MVHNVRHSVCSIENLIYAVATDSCCVRSYVPELACLRREGRHA